MISYMHLSALPRHATSAVHGPARKRKVPGKLELRLDFILMIHNDTTIPPSSPLPFPHHRLFLYIRFQVTSRRTGECSEFKGRKGKTGSKNRNHYHWSNRERRKIETKDREQITRDMDWWRVPSPSIKGFQHGLESLHLYQRINVANACSEPRSHISWPHHVPHPLKLYP